MTALLTGVIAILVALMARELKVSEFRQAWINGLRDEISEFTSKAHEWMELFFDINPHSDQEVKQDAYPKLNSLKYDAYRHLRKIQMRFQPNDHAANNLLVSLENLLDPGKAAADPRNLKGDHRYLVWRELADEAILEARALLKEEWETTKNPLRRVFRKLKTLWASLKGKRHIQDSAGTPWSETKDIS